MITALLVALCLSLMTGCARDLVLMAPTQAPTRRPSPVEAAPTPTSVPAPSATATMQRESSPTPIPTSTPIPTATAQSVRIVSTYPSDYSVLQLTAGNAVPPFPIVLGNEVIPDPSHPAKRFSIHRCASANACDALDPLSVRSPDGRYVLYNAVETSKVYTGLDIPQPGDKVTPIIRLLDLKTGQDRVYVRGARDPVWGANGQIAYTKGAEPTMTLGSPYPSQIIVRSSLNASPTIWTTTAEDYTCIAWARSQLICERADHVQWFYTSYNLVAFTGPNKFWLVAPRDPTLVALSPDGRRALVTSTYGQQDFRAVAYLVDLPSGFERAVLKLPASLENLQGNGQWIGDHVVAMRGFMPGAEMHPLPKLAILTINGDHLSLAHVYQLGLPQPNGTNGWAIEPRLIHGDVRHVGVWYQRIFSYSYADCLLTENGGCRLTKESTRFNAFLDNQSRPAASSKPATSK